MILSLILLAASLVACDHTGIGNTPTGSPEPTPAIPGETEKPEKTLTISEGIKCNYTIVRPELADQNEVDAAVALRNALVEAGAEDASIKEDFLYGDMKPAEYEILVG